MFKKIKKIPQYEIPNKYRKILDWERVYIEEGNNLGFKKEK